VTPDEIAAMLGRGGSILGSDAKFNTNIVRDRF
jgi:hypothetical protein